LIQSVNATFSSSLQEWAVPCALRSDTPCTVVTLADFLWKGKQRLSWEDRI
jgi:hypothetical protein